MEDISCLRIPEQTQQFDVSDSMREAVKVLGKFQESSENAMPCQKEHIVVRDYLLTMLCINNGSRSGGLANMTLGKFRAAKKHDNCLLSVFFDDYMSKLFPIFYLANFVCFYPSKYKAFPPNINYIFLILPYTK